MTETFSHVSTEVERVDIPRFFQEMAVDHPAVVSDILSRLPRWIQDVDALSGVTGMGQAIIDHLEYISHQEVEKHVAQVVTEIRQIWSENPDRTIRFISWLKNRGSGKWLYEQVLQSLTEAELQRNIALQGAHEVNPMQFSDKHPVYFFLDDSSNSGQQLKSGVFAFRSHTDELAASQTEVKLSIRLLRISAEMLNFLERQIPFFTQDSKEIVSIDYQREGVNKPMPTMHDVLDQLDLKKADIETSSLFLVSHGGRSPATLAVFWHKVQDNMPAVLIEGKMSQYIQPLITAENMQGIRVQYS